MFETQLVSTTDLQSDFSKVSRPNKRNLTLTATNCEELNEALVNTALLELSLRSNSSEMDKSDEQSPGEENRAIPPYNGARPKQKKTKF